MDFLFQALPQGEQELIAELALFQHWSYFVANQKGKSRYCQAYIEIPGTRTRIQFETRVPRILKTRLPPLNWESQ